MAQTSPASPPASPVASASVVPQKPWKILLIDQSPDFAQYLRTLLQDNAQFELSEWVDSGTGWINVWRTVKPDFLFVSLELSKRDGLFCVEKMRSMDPQIIIVFMHDYTGAMANSVELKAQAVGAAAVLQRPFTNERFHVVLKRCAQLKGKIVSIKRLKFG
jgi:DNA-binding NarL/FixJ family response regulator